MLAGMSRAQLKGQARARLLGQYGNAAGALVIIELISLVFMVVMMFGSGLAEILLYDQGKPGAMLPALVVALVLFVGIWMLYFVAAQIVMAGYTRLIYRSITEGESNLNDLTYALNRRMFRFIGLALAMFLVSVSIFVVFVVLTALLSVLFASHPVGMFIFFWVFFLFCMFLMVPLLGCYWMMIISLAEEPARTMKEAMGIVKAILKGNLWRMVKLELSFLGMYVLGYLSFGLGYLWIMPYSLASNILFYQQLKEERFGTERASQLQEDAWYWQERPGDWYPQGQPGNGSQPDTL